MKSTTRTKWLIGIAVGVAAWVAFGPGDSDTSEATHASPRPGARAARAPTGSTARRSVTTALQALAQRVAAPATAGSLFAAHSWYVPPPPPPPVVDATPAAPPKPTAPPLPYKLIGSYTPDGEPTVYFLTAGDKAYDVRIGDTLENTYSIDSFSGGQLVLTYKPLNLQQQLSLTGAAQ